MTHSIAIGSIFIECNHLGGAPADLETFRRTQLDYGSAVAEHDTGTVGGMLQTLREASAVIHPLLVASGCPSGPLTAGCYDHLKAEMLRRLLAALPVDGVLLALHGAASFEKASFEKGAPENGDASHAGDLEGDLLTAVRLVVGENTPIVATLDLHAHVSEAMVQAADALIAWETYPHQDAWETGVRGASALLDILNGSLRPTMALAKAPVLVSGVLGHTEGAGPFAEVMRLAKSLEREDDVYSVSAFLVHPYLDLPDMGGGGVVITNNNPQKAEQLAVQIAQAYWENRFDLEPAVVSPADAIAQGLKLEGGPIILVETADCCGGGAAGDSVATLKALLAAGGAGNSIAPVVDPQAAAACHKAGVGNCVQLRLGHRIDPQWGEPLEIDAVVLRLSSGAFQYEGGIWSGQTGNMGPTALVQLSDAVHALITSHATYEWRDEQFASVGANVLQFKFVVAKNPMNFHLAYGAISKAAFILDTPGPTPPTLKHVKFHNLRRPYFPRDEHIPNWAPRMVRSRPRFG